MANKGSALPILQLKILLKYSKPPIWRRIQISSDSTFLDLHATIQDSFGWEDYHLHRFIFGKRHEEPVSIGPREPEDWSDDWKNSLVEKETPLHDWFKQEGRTCTYEYDFGDSWEHTVVLEKILSAELNVTYPRCNAGKRACPPEDSGGVPGYEEKLEIIKHPHGRYYKETREWMGDFDPERFDLGEIEFIDVNEHDVEKRTGEK